jgi:hypothetical protein
MKFLLVVLSALALSAPAARADIEYCSGTATDSSGNVQSLSCPANFLNVLGSSITASNGTLRATLINYIGPTTFSASSGVFTQYVAETETSASGEFVIRGGSGTGELIANGGNDSIGVFNGVNVNEVFTSNFLPAPLPTRNGNQIVTIPFTFGVPFVLTVSDDMQLSAATGVGRALEVEDGTFWNALFSVYDSNGSPVPDASISEVPEVSSIWLLVAVLGVVGAIMCSRTRRPDPVGAS